jgi:ribosome biogenesis SPOUT family RNA methylase Rps3
VTISKTSEPPIQFTTKRITPTRDALNSNMTDSQKIYIVEHLDPELETWSSFEYASIARESHAAKSKFYLTSVPTTLKLPSNLQGIEGLNVENQSVEELFKERKSKVCLLDPSASVELSPEDGDVFEIFLFGGILGIYPPRSNMYYEVEIGF